MDAAIVSRLAAVGAAWNHNTARPPLPAQGPQIERPYTAVGGVPAFHFKPAHVGSRVRRNSRNGTASIPRPMSCARSPWKTT